MSKRHWNAIRIIDPGAVNPSGILYSMQEAIAEIREEHKFQFATSTPYNDVALRLMCHQLAYLLGADQDADFGKWMVECTEKAVESGHMEVNSD